MTGGSVGNQDSGLENNAPGLAINDFVFAASRQRSTSTLQLSMLGSAGTRSDEHIPLSSHCETAFDEHVIPRSCFLSNNMDHPGRLRTSSLTMDVSVRNRKEIDSGNSSLIDSSSADSYQDFGSGCRSPTTSSSKSEQSLTSVNHNEFQIDSDRQRHSSVSDSLGGSSGKMSINTSDITDSSEDSLTQDKNKEDVTQSVPVYVREDAYSDSECQPFLYLPGHHSLQASRDDITNGNIYPKDICESRRYGDTHLNYSSSDKFSLSLTNVDLSQVFHESLKKKERRRMKNKDINTNFKHTRAEKKPLLQDHECTLEKVTPDVVSLNNPFNFGLKRSASVGNFSELLLANLDTPVDCAVSPSTLPAANSHAKAAAYLMVTNQPQPDCTSDSHPVTFDHHLQIFDLSSRRESSPKLGSLSSHVLINLPRSHSPQPQPQQHQTEAHSHLCSNYDHPCMTHLMFNNEYEWPHVSEPTNKTSASCTSQPNAHINIQESCLPDTSPAVARSPVQNLESVLGYGTPVSLSVLKQGRKPVKSENEKPLEVLVPKIKVSPQEANRSDLTESLTPNTIIFQVKNNGNSVCLKADNSPQTESTRQTQKLLTEAQETLQLSTFNKETYLCDNKLRQEFDSRNQLHIHPHISRRNNQNLFVCERIAKEHLQYQMNNQTMTPSTRVPLSSQDHSELRTEGNVHRCLPWHCYNINCLPSNVNQHRSFDLNHFYNAGNGKQPTLWDGGCLSQPMFSQKPDAVPGKSNKDIEPKKKSLPTPHYILPPLRHSLEGQNVYPPVDHLAVDTNSPNTEHAIELKANVFDSGNEERNYHNTQEHPHVQYRHQADKLHTTNLPRDESDLSQTQMDDNGYQAGMTLTVPKACFVPGFLQSHDQINTSGTDIVVNSVPSAIDTVLPVNRNSSLQSTNPSQLGLLRANLDFKRQNEYFIREIPDYKYLCFVAIVLNPVLGLVALACNHCAQKDLQHHRRRRANNFYFATIAFSTVAIFFTLIGGALFIAHSVILKDAKQEVIPALTDSSCKDQFFGHDDSLQTFFGIDFTLYCEITKNEKIMQALKRFWLEDAHNKALHNKQRGHGAMPKDANRGNATDAGDSEMQLEDRDMFQAADLNDTNFLLGKKAAERQPLSVYDLIKSHLPQHPEQLVSNVTSNNSLARPNENPIIPPGMQQEYERYLGGEKRTKVNDGQSSVLRDLLPSGDQFSSPSEDISWTTTGSVDSQLPYNGTEGTVGGVTEIKKSYRANSTSVE